MSNSWEKLSPTHYTTSERFKEKASQREMALQDMGSQKTEAQFKAEPPRRSLDKLIVSEVTRTQILSMVAKIHHHQKLYREWNLQSLDPYGGRTAINLYGPPGTGKSFCAEAIAAELKKDIIRVNYAELESKYVGETSKNITAAFASAKAANAVLFFDEADSILGRRLTNVTQSADYSVNISRSVMLLELDRFGGTTIFATNLFRNYDSAFIRRILGHIEMPLPDLDCRRRLWELHLLPTIPGAQMLDPLYLAEQSEGLAGGDILNVVILAASNAVVRPEDQHILTLKDVTDALSITRKARDESGQEPVHPARTVTTTEVPVTQAPPEIQQAAQERENAVSEA
ncbi:MAG TPA: ATP-binding protein [Ktedonobacteraceae bacterium]|nr:ATP-binding protein [Ktedonobacteraceae bacterium]